MIPFNLLKLHWKKYLKWSARELYWKWRTSSISVPYYMVAHFIHLHWYAKETSNALHECAKGMGQMTHPGRDSSDIGVMLMSVKVRNDLINQASKVLSCAPGHWRK